MHEWNSSKKPAGQQWNRLLDAVVTIIKYKKITIDHAIYIKFFYYIKVSYPTFPTDDVLNTTNNNISFPKLRIVFEEHFEMKVQEGSIHKYLNFQNFQSPLGFSFDQNNHITELVNQWPPT